MKEKGAKVKVLIYSILPPELLIAGLESHSKKFEEVIDGIKVLVEPLEGNTAVISQILSTNPHDFLNSKLQPGRLISYVPN